MLRNDAPASSRGQGASPLRSARAARNGFIHGRAHGHQAKTQLSVVDSRWAEKAIVDGSLTNSMSCHGWSETVVFVFHPGGNFRESRISNWH